MAHLMQEYRGFHIYYDEDEDMFYSELQDRFSLRREPKRTSVKGLKQLIDETIKQNVSFQPFKALKSYISYDAEIENAPRKATSIPEEITIVGIKKDGGLFIQYNNKKERSQLNGKDRLKLFISDKNSDLIRADIATIEADISSLQKNKNKLLEKFKPLDLSFIDDFIK